MERLRSIPLVRFVWDMVDIYFDRRVGRAASCLAYWLILSFFPVLICVNGFIGALHVDVDSILNYLSSLLPPSLLGVVSDYLGYITRNESSTMLAVGVTTTVLAASAAMRCLMDAMDEIYQRKGYPGPVKVVVSVIFSVLLLVAIYLSVAVVLTGNWFFHLVERYLPFQWLPGTWNWQWIKFLVLFGVVFLLVVLVYLMAAPPGKPRAPVFFGAFLASVALAGASWVFSVFIAISSRYSLIYGSLASVIILLVWLYLCGNVLILGGVFNCVRYQRKKEKNISKNA